MVAGVGLSECFLSEHPYQHIFWGSVFQSKGNWRENAAGGKLEYLRVQTPLILREKWAKDHRNPKMIKILQNILLKKGAAKT